MQFTTILASTIGFASVFAIPMAQVVTETEVQYVTASGPSQAASTTPTVIGANGYYNLTNFTNTSAVNAGANNATAPETTLSVS